MTIPFQPDYPSRTQRNQFRFEPVPRRIPPTTPGVYGSIAPERDALALTSSKKKSGFFGKLIKGVAFTGAAILGGLAFKRYAPNVASQVGDYIPGLLKRPANSVAQSAFGQRIGHYGESLLNYSESGLAQLKNLTWGWFGKGAKQGI